MNELFSGLQEWFNNLPEDQASFLTSGFFIMIVVMIVVKYVLAGPIKWIAILLIAAVSFFWATGYPVPILSEYFVVDQS